VIGRCELSNKGRGCYSASFLGNTDWHLSRLDFGRITAQEKQLKQLKHGVAK